MDIARCTASGKYYTAVDFSRLPLEEMAWKRRMLQCPECGSAAFFRNATDSGNRTACFGARPHAEGCKLAAYDLERMLYSGNDPDALHMPDGKIVVDFEFGYPAQFQSVSQRENDSDRSVNFGQSDIESQRRLSSLLRLLIAFPDFRSSDQTIEVHGCSDLTVANFFVPVTSVSEQYIGQYRGFWGVLSDAKFIEEKLTVWFNCANSAVSFCLSSLYLEALNERYRPRDAEDFAGAYILVIGRLNTAENKKFYCVVDGIEHMALKYT